MCRPRQFTSMEEMINLLYISISSGTKTRLVKRRTWEGFRKSIHMYLSSLRGVNVQHVCDHQVMLAQDSTCSSWETALWVDYPNKTEYQQLVAKK
jgi:hypothetical protein